MRAATDRLARSASWSFASFSAAARRSASLRFFAAMASRARSAAARARALENILGAANLASVLLLLQSRELATPSELLEGEAVGGDVQELRVEGGARGVVGEDVVRAGQLLECGGGAAAVGVGVLGLGAEREAHRAGRGGDVDAEDVVGVEDDGVGRRRTADAEEARALAEDASTSRTMIHPRRGREARDGPQRASRWIRESAPSWSSFVAPSWENRGSKRAT